MELVYIIYGLLLGLCDSYWSRGFDFGGDGWMRLVI